VPVRAVATLHGGSAGLARVVADGSLEVVVSAPGRSLEGAAVLPLRGAATAAGPAGSLHLRLPGPGTWTVLPADDPDRALHVGVQAQVPGTGSRPDLTFGPGVHLVDRIDLHDGDRLWIDPRGVLRARPPTDREPRVEERNWAGNPVWRPFITAAGARGVVVAGGGTIDLSDLPWHARMGMVFWECRDLRVDGVTIIDPPAWAVAVFRSHGAVLRDLRIIGDRENSDSLDICNSQEVVVEDAFLRTNDDGVSVKTTDPAPAPPSATVAVRRITVWNERARALGVTSETRHDIRNVVFADCDIIRDHSAGGECSALAVLVADRGTVADLWFRDIRIHHGRDTTALLRIFKDAWGKDDRRGRIAGVGFADVALAPGVPARFRLEGHGPEHRIDGVSITGFTVAGRAATPAITVNAFVAPVRVGPADR
jgi:hypothetical protein